MAKITYIEGACVSEHDHEFSIQACMNNSGLSVHTLRSERYDRMGGEDTATDVTCQVQTHQVIVTIFNSDGEAYFYIGLKSDFVGADFI